MKDLEQFSEAELIAVILEQRQRIETLRKQIEELRKENEELRSRLDGAGKAMPHWVKPSRQKPEKKERKKRTNAFVRKKDTPTEVVCYAVEQC